MIVPCRSEQRHHDRRPKRESWFTFGPANRKAPPADDGFAALERLTEHRLSPGARVLGRVFRDAEIVTYVRDGSMIYEDSTGHSALIRTGEFQHVAAKRGSRHDEMNPSRIYDAHIFQLWLRPSPSNLVFEPSHNQRCFSTAQRRGWLSPVTSQEPRSESLRIHQDTMIYSALLEPGQHVVHELRQGRSAWLHVVRGAAQLGDIVLTTGDGAGITAERTISLTSRDNVEILLLDFGEPSPTPTKNGVVL